MSETSENPRDILGKVSVHMIEFHHSLEKKAGEMEAKGEDPEIVGKLKSGADAMRDSANIYLSWGRHFVALAEGEASESDECEEDSTDFQF
jgi:hypothetical protein